MIAFASNSLLCRAALKQTAIDAATFTFVRILSGAVALWLIIILRRSRSAKTSGNWPSALALFAYAAGFSFAYLNLPAGTGALLLFGAVQVTMIFGGFRKGERLDAIQVAGVAVAVVGLIALVFPGISAPPVGASFLMLGAGLAWGVYSLRGKSVSDPLTATSGNFVRALPFAVLPGLITISKINPDLLGLQYAVISGAITSGVGYVIWYSVLPDLNATNAATVQLSVPVIAATGGILFLHEPITVRYVMASVAVLGGVFLVIIERKARTGRRYYEKP